uniref:THIF-type NAD/FAD binding fold domain-containing protein n=1 Tax=Tetradesmus obliquus TaxID=3088 RepID=A0A383W834_TETOB|eukprot:jgi/Sobl393_1/15788/SZX73591.1
MSPARADELKDEEAAVYDRQLRVWGVEVQRKLTAARVLLVGFGKLAAEATKNITLAGVGHVTLLDDTPAAQLAGHNFLVTPAAAGEHTAAQAAAATLQAMNPLVKVSAAAGPAAAAAASADALAGQDLVIATGAMPLGQLQQLNAAARRAGASFMAGGASGPGGWFFVDLRQHSYVPKGSAGADSDKVTLQYSALAEVLAPPAAPLPATTHAMYYVLLVCAALEQQLQRPLTAADLPAAQQQLQQLAAASPQLAAAQQQLAAHLAGAAEFAPVAAVLGGIIANNVVAAVSGSGAPLNNMLFYSLLDGRAIVETQPAGDGAGQPGKAAGGAAAGSQQQQQQQAHEVVID